MERDITTSGDGVKLDPIRLCGDCYGSRLIIGLSGN
jgi:hypothetical protein